MPRSRQEIRSRVAYHRKAIEALAKMYDEGEPLAALGIAVSTYLMVHDPSPRDRSLLTQLGLRAKLRFVASTPPADPKNMLRQTPLTMQRAQVTSAGVIARYVPFLNDDPNEHRLVQFHTWWEDDLIYLDGDAKMNRRKLVFILRSQEGGAHYDMDLLNPYFERLSVPGLTTPFLLAEGQSPQPLIGAEYAMMRQIAWELTTTLDRAEIA